MLSDAIFSELPKEIIANFHKELRRANSAWKSASEVDSRLTDILEFLFVKTKQRNISLSIEELTTVLPHVEATTNSHLCSAGASADSVHRKETDSFTCLQVQHCSQFYSGGH